MQDIKENKAKNGNWRSELYSKHFLLTNYGNYQCFLRPFPLSDLEIGLYPFLCLHQFLNFFFNWILKYIDDTENYVCASTFPLKSIQKYPNIFSCSIDFMI